MILARETLSKISIRDLQSRRRTHLRYSSTSSGDERCGANKGKDREQTAREKEVLSVLRRVSSQDLLAFLFYSFYSSSCLYNCIPFQYLSSFVVLVDHAIGMGSCALVRAAFDIPKTFFSDIHHRCHIHVCSVIRIHVRSHGRTGRQFVVSLEQSHWRGQPDFTRTTGAHSG